MCAHSYFLIFKNRPSRIKVYLTKQHCTKRYFVRERGFPSSNVTPMGGEGPYTCTNIWGPKIQKLANEEMRLLRLLGLITDTGGTFIADESERLRFTKSVTDYFGSWLLKFTSRIAISPWHFVALALCLLAIAKLSNHPLGKISSSSPPISAGLWKGNLRAVGSQPV